MDLIRLQTLVRLEFAALAIGSIALFIWSGQSWLLFAVLILAPDLSMIFYLGGPGIGAIAYNLAHTLLLPAALMLWAWLSDDRLLWGLAAISLAHISIDRVLGYGLKYSSDFKDTHMGRIGGASASEKRI